MALSAPIPIIEGSQTEFSKVWIRGSTATSTLPNLRFYKADGRIVHPIAAALDITIVHTAADTLYNRIQAAITAADATKTAAWVAKWFGKHQIVGVTSDAITGDTLLVNRAETTGITASNDEPTARAAADFFAQETYAVGALFKHGIIPGDQSGLNGATVNVSGEVLTASSYRQGTLQTATLLAANDALTLNCEGMGQAIFECTALAGSGSPSVTFCMEASIDGGTKWIYAPSYYTTSAGSIPNTASATLNIATTNRYFVNCAGATHVRLRATAVSTTAPTPTTAVIQGIAQAANWAPAPILASGLLDIFGRQTHDVAASTYGLQAMAEARSTDGTAVGSGDAVRLLATLLGKLVSMPYALPGQTWQYAGPAGGITDTADDVVVASAGAGFRNYITAIQVVNMSTTATEVVIKDGSTVIWRCELDADGGASGISVNFPTPLRGTAATAVNVACLTTSSKVFVNAQGFSAAE